MIVVWSWEAFHGWTYKLVNSPLEDHESWGQPWPTTVWLFQEHVYQDCHGLESRITKHQFRLYFYQFLALAQITFSSSLCGACRIEIRKKLYINLRDSNLAIEQVSFFSSQEHGHIGMNSVQEAHTKFHRNIFSALKNSIFSIENLIRKYSHFQNSLYPTPPPRTHILRNYNSNWIPKG